MFSQASAVLCVVVVQEKLNCRAVVKVSYAVGVKKEGGQQQPEAKTAEATTKQ